MCLISILQRKFVAIERKKFGRNTKINEMISVNSIKHVFKYNNKNVLGPFLAINSKYKASILQRDSW